MISLRAPRTLEELRGEHGGVVLRGGSAITARVARIEDAREGDLAPLLAQRHLRDAKEAIARGAVILADEALAARVRGGAVWAHRHGAWALAEVLDQCVAPSERAIWGEDCTFGENVVMS